MTKDNVINSIPASQQLQQELGLILDCRPDALRKRLLESIEYLEKKEYKVLSTEVPLEYLDLWTIDIPDENKPQDSLFLKILYGDNCPQQLPVAFYVFDLVNQRRYKQPPILEFAGLQKWSFFTVEFWTFCMIAKLAILKRNPEQPVLEFDIWDKSKCDQLWVTLVENEQDEIE